MGEAALPSSNVVYVEVVRNTSISDCSGTLLSNRWVLTARHCFCASDPSTPSNTNVFDYGLANYTSDAGLRKFYATTADQIILNPTYDAALVHLATTLPTGDPLQVYTGNGSDLVGKGAPGQTTVTTAGYGYNDDYTSQAGKELFWGRLEIASVSAASVPASGSACSEPVKANPGPRTAQVPGVPVYPQAVTPAARSCWPTRPGSSSAWTRPAPAPRRRRAPAPGTSDHRVPSLSDRERDLARRPARADLGRAPFARDHVARQQRAADAG